MALISFASKIHMNDDRPMIRSTQINPFPNDIALPWSSSFIRSFDRNNATIYLFPFKSSVLQPNKNDSYRFGQKGNRSCHDKKDPRFVSLVRAFVLIFHLVKMPFSFFFAFISGIVVGHPHTHHTCTQWASGKREKFHGIKWMCHVRFYFRNRRNDDSNLVEMKWKWNT